MKDGGVEFLTTIKDDKDNNVIGSQSIAVFWKVLDVV